MKRPARSSVAILAASVILLIGVGGAVGVASAAKPSFSSSVADYIPATIADKKVVIDPRSTEGFTTPSCEIPPGGLVLLPTVEGKGTPSVVLGGVWDCPGAETGQLTAGTGFVVGLEAANVRASAPKLTKKFLYTPPDPANAGSVRAVKVNISGLAVTVFLYRVTNTTADASGPVGTVFEVASAEPKPHHSRSEASLSVFPLVAATTPDGVKPLPYLTAMLKAGAGTIPRAG